LDIENNIDKQKPYGMRKHKLGCRRLGKDAAVNEDNKAIQEQKAKQNAKIGLKRQRRTKRVQSRGREEGKARA